MIRNLFIFSLCAILLIIGVIPAITCYTISPNNNLSSVDTSPQPVTYQLYNDVNILMISKLYESINIEGVHDSQSGQGYDEKITFEEANNLFTIGIAIIWDKNEIHKWGFNGGWIHTKLEIFEYNGWMSGHHQSPRVKLIGHCEMINITVYR